MAFTKTISTTIMGALVVGGVALGAALSNPAQATGIFGVTHNGTLETAGSGDVNVDLFDLGGTGACDDAWFVGDSFCFQKDWLLGSETQQLVLQRVALFT